MNLSWPIEEIAILVIYLYMGKTNKALNAHNTSDEDSTKCKKPCVVCNMFERGIHNTKPGVVDIKTSRHMQECRSCNVV